MDVTIEKDGLQMTPARRKQERLIFGLMPGTWIGIGTLVMGLLAGGTSILVQIFATKVEVAARVSAVEKRLKPDLAEWRLQALEARMENLRRRQERDSNNITRLLERFRVEKAPDPEYVPIPTMPKYPGGVESE